MRDRGQIGHLSQACHVKDCMPWEETTGVGEHSPLCGLDTGNLRLMNRYIRGTTRPRPSPANWDTIEWQ
jgi:hypothetical protein